MEKSAIGSFGEGGVGAAIEGCGQTAVLFYLS